MTLNCLPSTLLIHLMQSDTPFECNLGLFDRINIAQCAAKRAHMNVMDGDRFRREFDTARMWTRYKCYISTKGSFVELD
jgi:hypothetical protein